jgi:shikimate kinase
VAEALHFGFLDTDHFIEMRAGLSIPELFAQQGEPVFRKLEQLAVAELAHFNKMVIATGGGLGANLDNLASLKQHALVICLWATPETIWERVRHQQHRPLLHDPNPQGKIASLLAERGPIYRQADVLVSTEQRNLRDVVQQVIHQFGQARGRGA